MLLEDFNYNLPPELIAQTPLSKRSDSRLLCLNKTTGEITHHNFRELYNILAPNDLLVLNNTRVIPARLYTHKATGGKVEVMIERITSNNSLIAQTKSSKSLKIGEKLFLDDNSWFEINGRKENLFVLSFHSAISLDQALNRFGKIPLPPYIRRAPDLNDAQHYQTIYAKQSGAVAAPTAGLHFDQQLMDNLKQNKIKNTSVTLHVGLGTFQPVRVEKIEDHKIHPEYIEVSKTTCDDITSTKKDSGRVIAVGTTSLRALEATSQSGEINPYQGDTDIFIYPGYKFKTTEILITNFHLPKTSLLMLVAAFAGHENMMGAYQEAIKQKYRFYSYGDAMLIV